MYFRKGVQTGPVPLLSRGRLGSGLHVLLGRPVLKGRQMPIFTCGPRHHLKDWGDELEERGLFPIRNLFRKLTKAQRTLKKALCQARSTEMRHTTSSLRRILYMLGQLPWKVFSLTTGAVTGAALIGGERSFDDRRHSAVEQRSFDDRRSVLSYSHLKTGTVMEHGSETLSSNPPELRSPQRCVQKLLEFRTTKK